MRKSDPISTYSKNLKFLGLHVLQDIGQAECLFTCPVPLLHKEILISSPVIFGGTPGLQVHTALDFLKGLRTDWKITSHLPSLHLHQYTLPVFRLTFALSPIMNHFSALPFFHFYQVIYTVYVGRYIAWLLPVQGIELSSPF